MPSLQTNMYGDFRDHFVKFDKMSNVQKLGKKDLIKKKRSFTNVIDTLETFATKPSQYNRYHFETPDIFICFSFTLERSQSETGR